VSAEGVLDINALGSLAPGVSVGAAARVQRMSLGLYGVVLPGQSQAVSAEQSVTFGLLALALRGCYGMLGDRLTLAACAGLELGRLHADSSGLIDSRRVNDLWLAPSAGLELRASIRPTLAAALRAEVLRPLPRKQYAVDETVVIHRPPALAPRLYLGVSWSVD
jgi:hypothetical protein